MVVVVEKEVAYVESTMVAHKIGETDTTDEGTEPELPMV